MLKNRVYVPTNPTPVEANGAVFVASDDKVFSIDAASGALKWQSKSSSLGLISGLEVAAGTVIVRQGLYADSNDYGAPTSVVTQLLGPSFEEEPEVYIEEDPYGYVGLDEATGKESWKCLEFEAHDAQMKGAMPKDSAVCRVAKVSKEKSCKLGKLGIGNVIYSYVAAGNVVYVGKDGMAGAPPGSCTASWKVEGAIKKHAKIYEVASGGERKGSLFVQHDDPPYLVTHYEKDVNVVDVAAGKILVTSDKGDSVKVKWSKKMLFVAEGNDLAMYKLP
jgi:outer membrane protein assembly factor BamB